MALLAGFVSAPVRSSAIERSSTQERRPGSANAGVLAQVVLGHELRFPYDEGSHPAFRTEWWYITGWLDVALREALGFQITFFRARHETDERNRSAFAPRQIIIAHAALSDRAQGKLLNDQRIGRAALGVAGATEGQTGVWLDDWSLRREETTYRSFIPARDFSLDLRFSPTQPPLLQGNDGVSRKGPRPESASFYYSMPHLTVAGTVVRSGKRSAAAGNAWLDHEWSSSYMDERAVGWDWIGINLDDGGALMAFRMRNADGSTLWAGGTYRDARGIRRAFDHRQIDFSALRIWRSPRTGTRYPVAWRIRVGSFDIIVEPLMDDQESDTRVSVGAVYWEGAVSATREKKPVGRGYLELTGYDRPLRL